MREGGLEWVIDEDGTVRAPLHVCTGQPVLPLQRAAAVREATSCLQSGANNQSSGHITMTSDDIGTLRAQEYLLLAALLRRPVTQDLLGRLVAITGDASPLGMAHITLAQAAEKASERAAGREFFNLFIGVGRGELLPYASFYLTGFLNERPLGRVREDLAKLGIERAEGNHDPEDHISTLLETMAGIASGDIEADAAAERAFFERHLKPWAARFFADLGVAPSAEFYQAVAGVGRTFIAIETEAFTLPDGAERSH